EPVEDLFREWRPEARQPAAPPGDVNAGVDLGGREGNTEPVEEESVDAEGDERCDRRPEERRLHDRRPRLGRPWPLIEPALQVGRAETDPARHEKAETRGWREDQEVAKQRAPH